MTQRRIQISIEIDTVDERYDQFKVTGTLDIVGASTVTTVSERQVARSAYTEERWGRWYITNREAANAVGRVLSQLS